MWDVIHFIALAVCSDRAVSLFICTPYPGADFFAGYHGNHLRGHRQNNLPRYDALLG